MSRRLNTMKLKSIAQPTLRRKRYCGTSCTSITFSICCCFSRYCRCISFTVTTWFCDSYSYSIRCMFLFSFCTFMYCCLLIAGFVNILCRFIAQSLDFSATRRRSMCIDGIFTGPSAHKREHHVLLAGSFCASACWHERQTPVKTRL